MLRLRPALAALAAAALLVTAACDLSTSNGTQDVEPTDLVYHPSLDIDFTEMTLTNEGVYYQDLVVGDGETIAVDDRIQATYRLWLPNGTQIPQNVPPGGVPFTLKTGPGGVIAGWVAGVRGMKEGGTRKLVIRPSLAYGSTPPAGIPPNSVLVFEVTVLEKLLPESD